MADVTFPCESSVDFPWPLRYQIPGAPVIGLGKKGPCPITRAVRDPSGSTRSWDDPVPMTVIDLT